MTRLNTNALRTISAAMLISILAAVTGCSDRKPDIDYDLIGGTYEAGENEYKVQIFSDSSDTTAEAPAESETEATTSSTPETTKSTTTDLPKVTAEPQYTTASTTTTKPKQTEPTEIETDENGFPANPQNGDKFTDSTGQEYQFNSVFDAWIPGNSGNVNMQEFPDNYGEIGSGQQVLH